MSILLLTAVATTLSALPWHQQQAACPDGWARLKMRGDWVVCGAGKTNRGTCNPNSLFNQNYDRCNWAKKCKTRWTDCDVFRKANAQSLESATSHAEWKIPPTRHRYKIKFGSGRTQVDGAAAEKFFQRDHPWVRYRQFNGNEIKLYPWFGNHIVYLTTKKNLSKKAMYAILAFSDRGYAGFQDVTGGEPARSKQYTISGRATIAIVPRASCGAGCGRVGGTGIEFTENIWSYHKLAANLEADRPFQIGFLPFYEMGRNFTIFNRYLKINDRKYGSATGSMFSESFKMTYLYIVAKEKIPVSKGGQLVHALPKYRKILNSYLRRRSLNSENTLIVGRDGEGKKGKAYKLMLAIILDQAEKRGGYSFLKRFWRAVSTLDRPTTPQDVLDNYFLAMSKAAGKNLAAEFEGRYRWKLSAKAKDLAARMDPGPPARLASFFGRLLTSRIKRDGFVARLTVLAEPRRK